ncbi:MAG: 4-hydroxythreonine-4-phosphate dehydrogenase PdxA, partial [Pseudomonadota bacterium]
LHEIAKPSEALCRPGCLDIIPLSRLRESWRIPGRPHIEGGKAMVSYIVKAVEMAGKGEIAGMVTCPISKALMQEAGYAYEGHTQLLAHLTGCEDFVMMLAGERLRVTLVTIHTSIRDVPGLLSVEKVLKTLSITSRAPESDFGIRRPRLAVAALNPHAGEGGLFGMEEEMIIRPAVESARRSGIEVEGPLPADTLFYKAAAGRYDAVVCMYHDQGLIPLKLLHFSDGVNITLGLPVVRTSVDHGTAYDIAGRGEADPSSLIAAVRTAVTMARNRAEGKNRDI